MTPRPSKPGPAVTVDSRPYSIFLSEEADARLSKLAGRRYTRSAVVRALILSESAGAILAQLESPGEPSAEALEAGE